MFATNHQDLESTTNQLKEFAESHCSQTLRQALSLCNYCEGFQASITNWTCVFIHVLIDTLNNHKYSPFYFRSFGIIHRIHFLGF